MAADAAGNLYLAGRAVLTNALGSQTTDLVTVKLAPTSGSNSPPQVSMDVNGSNGSAQSTGEHQATASQPTTPIITGRNLTISAQASDQDGTVSRVDFYDGSNLLGTVTTPPYNFQWNNAPLGNHALIGTATDNMGAMRSSETVVVTVTDATPTPTPPVGLQYYPLPRPLRLLDTRPGQPACVTPGAPLSVGTDRTQNARVTCDNITSRPVRSPLSATPPSSTTLWTAPPASLPCTPAMWHDPMSRALTTRQGKSSPTFLRSA